MFDDGKKFELLDIDEIYELEDVSDFVRFDNKEELEKFLDEKYQDEDIKKSKREKYFSFIYYANYYCDLPFFKEDYIDIKDPYLDYENLTKINFPSFSVRESLELLSDAIDTSFATGFGLYPRYEGNIDFVRNNYFDNDKAAMYAFEVYLDSEGLKYYH